MSLADGMYFCQIRIRVYFAVPPKTMPIKYLLRLLPLVFLLSACSGHPGAGGWRATTADPIFERLEVRFNGNADFYTNTTDEQAAWRCFWGASSKQTAGFKCVQASNADNEKEYSLIVDEDGKTATLEQGDKVLGRYVWQAPTDI